MKTKKRFVFPALLGVVLLVLTSRVFSAQLPVEIRIKAAMKEIEEKIEDEVKKKPISETDKVDIKKKLKDTARSKVRKFIEWAPLNKLPEVADVVNAVMMKDILPQLEDLMAGKSANVLPSPQTNTQSSSSKPKAEQKTEQKPKQRDLVIIYVMSNPDIDVKIKESVGVGIFDAFTNTKRYVAIKSDEDFFAEVSALRSVQIDNAVYDDQISEIGKKFGATFVCVAEITTTSEAYHILTRMIDVRTAKVASVGNAFNPLKSDDDIADVSVDLVRKMVGGRIDPIKKRMKADTVVVKTDTVVIKSDTVVIKPDTVVIRRDTNNIVEYTTMMGVSLGYGLSQDVKSRSDFLQVGFVYSNPFYYDNMSLNVEGDLGIGVGEYKYKYYDGSDYNDTGSTFNFFSVDVPVTVSYQLWKISFEAGLHGNALLGDGELLFNAGFVAGLGVVFDEKRAWRCFYRYSSGFNYGTHFVGAWWLF